MEGSISTANIDTVIIITRQLCMFVRLYGEIKKLSNVLVTSYTN